MIDWRDMLHAFVSGKKVAEKEKGAGKDVGYG